MSNFCLAKFLYLNIVIHLFSYKNNCIFVLFEMLRLLDRNQRCFQLYLKLYIPKETCIKIRCPLFDVRDAHHILLFTARVIDTRNLKTPVFIIHILFFNKLIEKKIKILIFNYKNYLIKCMINCIYFFFLINYFFTFLAI